MKSATLKLRHNLWVRAGMLITGVALLLAVYFFQRAGAAGLSADFHPNTVFIISRSARLILNDFACFLIIFAIFKEAKYLRIAFWVFLLELVVILPVYLVIKLALEGDSEISSPLLSQVHRLIVNPMLMILLIAGFFYQRIINKGQTV